MIAVNARVVVLTTFWFQALVCGRSRASGCLPGLWIHLPGNLEYLKELTVAEGGYLQLHESYDDGERQGTALCRKKVQHFDHVGYLNWIPPIREMSKKVE